MSVRSHRVAAVSTGAAILVALSSVGAVASGLVTSADIKDGAVKKADIASSAVGSDEILDGSVRMSDLAAGVRSKLGAPSPLTPGSAGQPGPAGPQGPKGDTGPQGPQGDPASDVAGTLAAQAQTTGLTPIAKIGGRYADNATDLFTFQLPEAGTYLVNAYGYFDRLNATEDGYEAPSTDTYLQLTLRGDGGVQAGTYFTGPVSRSGYTETTASGAQVVTVAAPTSITVRAFGYNEDRSGFGGAPNSSTPQFSVFANASAVRVG